MEMRKNENHSIAEETINRQKVLKSMGIVGAISAYPSSIVSAEENEVVEFDQEEIDRQMNIHATETLELLSDENIIKQSLHSEFETQDHKPLRRFVSETEGVTVISTAKEDISTKSIRVKTDTKEGVVTLVVEPNTERSYAFLDPGKGETPLLYTPEKSTPIKIDDDEVTTQGTCTNEECSPVECLEEWEVCAPVVGCTSYHSCTCGC